MVASYARINAIPAEPGGTTSIMPVTNAIERRFREVRRRTRPMGTFQDKTSMEVGEEAQATALDGQRLDGNMRLSRVRWRRWAILCELDARASHSVLASGAVEDRHWLRFSLRKTANRMRRQLVEQRLGVLARASLPRPGYALDQLANRHTASSLQRPAPGKYGALAPDTEISHEEGDRRAGTVADRLWHRDRLEPAV
jgi:hypothetical protein